MQYLNEVRAAHIYQDLENTDLSVAEIMEQNGFTNQKLFNRTFKAIYGCTPSAVRKGSSKKTSHTATRSARSSGNSNACSTSLLNERN